MGGFNLIHTPCPLGRPHPPGELSPNDSRGRGMHSYLHRTSVCCYFLEAFWVLVVWGKCASDGVPCAGGGTIPGGGVMCNGGYMSLGISMRVQGAGPCTLGTHRLD